MGISFLRDTIVVSVTKFWKITNKTKLVVLHLSELFVTVSTSYAAFHLLLFSQQYTDI